MKNRFTTLDIAYLIHELRHKLVGLRVDQVYDIDKKTYLIRLAKSGEKRVLLIESGTRFHTTQFNWPKNPAPSGFTMKLRKHLSNKRLEKLEMVGADRIVHLQFGTDAAAYHLFLELYDRGNLILTDHTFTILNLVRPRIVGEERMAAHEKYALEKAKQNFAIERDEIDEILRNSKPGTLRELFLSKLEFGPALFSYVLKHVELTPQTKVAQLMAAENGLENTIEKLSRAFAEGTEILRNIQNNGGIIVLAKSTGTAQSSASQSEPVFYEEFHPLVIAEFYEGVLKYDSFDEAVDEFFSKIESQKIDMKQINQEKDALKKLEKVKLDQHKRLKELQEGQEVDKQKAELITVNQKTVDLAITTIRKLIAGQLSWDDIEEQLKEARAMGDPLASIISKLNLKQNRITLKLSNVYDEEQKPVEVDVDLNFSAFANASKYFDLKKASARKEERTIESQEKAFKSTEKKTMATLKEAATIHSIKKARKVMWFEKFRWFITSENYLVIGGRDAQQNELLVKRYLRPRDVYMHADAHGAPTLIIKNDNPSEDIPPKTLNEGGIFAVSCSGSWESKIVPSSWWVWGDQVSKSAPTGEYLPTGSFMVRGKKNYLPPYQLVLGFGLLFRLTEDSVESHKNERARKGGSDESTSVTSIETRNEKEEDLLDEEFPDTQVKISVDGEKLRTRLSSSNYGEEDNDEYIVTSAMPTSAATSVQKLKNKQKKDAKQAKSQGLANKKSGQQGKAEPVDKHVEDDASQQNRPKRGQHGRKKKLKEKYKFQDDEERELRMKLLRAGHSALLEKEPSPVTTKSEASDDDADHTVPNLEEDSKIENKSSEQQPAPTTLEDKDEAEAKGDVDNVAATTEEVEEEEVREGETELDLLKTLTGSPIENDELLYAVPVVAPYSTLQNYKFRIKMVPGTQKRGKAAKTALESFLREKDATQREKDLIKAVKDQDFTRNFPGKVKLSNVIRDKK